MESKTFTVILEIDPEQDVDHTQTITELLSECYAVVSVIES